MSQQASKSVQALKMPPILIDEAGYVEWKEDLKIWELYSYIEKKKRQIGLEILHLNKLVLIMV